MSHGFAPDQDTVDICWQVFKAALLSGGQRRSSHAAQGRGVALRHDRRVVRQHPMHHLGEQVVGDERPRLMTGPGSTTGAPDRKPGLPLG
jgi:hypothetical protein